MSHFVGISPLFSSIFSQNAHGFINIHEYYYMIILKLDHLLKYYCLSINLKPNLGDHSGSVVGCLTRDRGAVSSSRTGVIVLWSLSKKHLS